MCSIADCGELEPGQDFGLTEKDGTADTFPSFPEDSDLDLSVIPSVIDAAETIKVVGNDLFKSGNYLDAVRRYKKALRYVNKALDAVDDGNKDVKNKLNELKIQCLLNRYFNFTHASETNFSHF